LITEHPQPSACLVDIQDYEFMQRRIQILEGIAKGEKEIVESPIQSNEQAKQNMSKWLK